MPKSEPQFPPLQLLPLPAKQQEHLAGSHHQQQNQSKQHSSKEFTPLPPF